MRVVTENYNDLKISIGDGNVEIEGLQTGKKIRMTYDQAINLSHGKAITIGDEGDEERVTYDHSRVHIFGREIKGSAIFGWMLEKSVRAELGI